MAVETVELTPAEQLGEFIEEIQDAYRDVERELRELNMLVDQSRGAVDKLAQRNSTIGGHLRQLQANLESVPRADLKTAYEAAADAQQRLFTMRGQMDKLKSEQAGLQRLLDVISKTRSVLESLPLSGRAGLGEAGQDGTQPPIVRIINAQEAERRRLSRAMHDGPAQSLTNFVLQAEIVQRLFENDPVRCRAELTNLIASRPQLAHSMLEQLETWERALAGKQIETGEAEYDEATLHRLRGLGYIA